MERVSGRARISIALLMLIGGTAFSPGYAAPQLVPGYRLERFVPMTRGPDIYGATSIAYDPYDDIFYLTDSYQGRVWRLDSSRDVTVLAEGFDVPKDVAVDPITGDVYVADFYTGEVLVIGYDEPLVSGLGLASAVATSQTGDRVGDTYVADAENGVVYYVNFDQSRLDPVASGFDSPNDLLYDPVYDVIFVVDTGVHTGIGAVYLVDPSLGIGFNKYMVTDVLDMPLFADFGFENDLLVTLASGEIVSIDLTQWIVGQRAPVYPFGWGFTDLQGLVSLPIGDELPDRIFAVDREEGVVYRLTKGTGPPDSDDDGISDEDEFAVYGTDPYAPDSDWDGLYDDEEIEVYGTNPVLPDTDGDGLFDGFEVLSAATDPLEADTDQDGYNDGWEYYVITDPLGAADTPSLRTDFDGDYLRGDLEVFGYGTDPLDPDSDGDGAEDWAELAIGSDPLDETVENSSPLFDDSDADGLSRNTELVIGTDPTVADTDGDGVPDGREVLFDGTDPLDELSVEVDKDPDGDGLATVDELIAGTDPDRPDTDGDGIVDSAEAYGDLDTDGLCGYEENIFGTDPDNPDTDGDGVLDEDEALADSDGDGLVLIDEVRFGTSDDSPDTDGDGATDYDEAVFDLDGDGLTGFEEVTLFGTEPDEIDTDGDGFPDGQEIAVGTDPLAVVSSPADVLDLDGDGLSGAEELAAGTDPDFADTDGDGHSDGVERIIGSDPADSSITNLMLADTDGDGLADNEETFYGTRADAADTDGDGYTDGIEVALFGTDPLSEESTPADVLDLDGDGLTGAEESAFGTDPLDPDTNGDGTLDGIEARQDLDGDGLNGFDEVVLGTDVYRIDTDGDGLADYEEAMADPDEDGVRTLDELRFGTDPEFADTDSDGTDDYEVYYGDVDGDGLPGVFERVIGTDPLAADTDGDGATDGIEHAGGTDPLRDDDLPGTLDSEFDDVDGDGLACVVETDVGTDPLAADTDGDGLSDGDEVCTERTDPIVADSDGDGYTDSEEVALATDPTDPMNPPPDATPGPPQLIRVVLRPATGPVFVGTEISFTVDAWLTDGTRVPADDIVATYRMFGAGTLDTATGEYIATRPGRAAVSATVELGGIRRAGGTTFIVHAGSANLAVGSTETDPGDAVTLPVTFGTESFQPSAVDLELHYDPAIIEISDVVPAPALAEAGKTLTWSVPDGPGSGRLRIRVSGTSPAVVPSGKLCDLDIGILPEAPDTMTDVRVETATAIARAVRASYWLGTSVQGGGRILVESGEPPSGTPDINGDEEVDAVDVQKAINQVLGLLRSVGDAVADVDQDGHIDAVDVQLVINTALGILPL